MGNVRQQILATSLVIGFMVVMMLPTLFFAAPWKRRFQFRLSTFLVWVVTPAAIALWIATWDGDFFSPRRALTRKMGAIVLLLAGYLGAISFRAIFGEVKRRRDDVDPKGESTAEG